MPLVKGKRKTDNPLLRPNYSLEFLRDKFAEDAVKADEQQKELIKKFQENHPGEPLMEYLANDFSLPIALKSIVDELINLKKMKK
jgi:hypothetical protein